MSKKSEIWVSAVLYIAVGVIVISIILSAGIPLINKIKDRNTVIETKKLLFTLDDTLRTVANEGPGSQRELPSFNIDAGKLIIDKDMDEISWSIETKAFLLEPNAVVNEGVISMSSEKSKKEGFYIVKLQTNYHNFIDLELNSKFGNPIFGKYSLLIKHTGRFSGKRPIIEIVVN